MKASEADAMLATIEKLGISIVEYAGDSPPLVAAVAWRKWDKIRDRFKVKVAGVTVANLAPLVEMIVLVPLVGRRPTLDA